MDATRNALGEHLHSHEVSDVVILDANALPHVGSNASLHHALAIPTNHVEKDAVWTHPQMRRRLLTKPFANLVEGLASAVRIAWSHCLGDTEISFG
jgi:hypothetical protein